MDTLRESSEPKIIIFWARKKVKKNNTDAFTKENDIGLHISTACLAFRDFLGVDVVLHLLVVEGAFTINASLRGEATMRFDELVIRYSCSTFEGVYVLRETSVEEGLFG
jgi:hypothetical protein